MSSSQKNLSFISWQLLSELDEMKYDQYVWLMQARDILLGNWELYRARYRSWRRKVDGLVDDLVQKGDTDGANWLTQTLLRDPIISNPAEFELTIPTGNGTEVIHIRGCPDQPPAATAQQSPTVPGPDAVDAQLPLPSLAAAPRPDGASAIAKEKRGQSHSALPQPSAAPDTEDPIPTTKQHPTKASKEPQVTTRAQSSRGKRKETVQYTSRKKIARHASPQDTKTSPGRPAQSALSKEIDPDRHYLYWTVKNLQEEVQANGIVTTAAAQKTEATLIYDLLQNDKDGDNDPADTSQLALDEEASTPKATEDEARQATGDGAVSAAGDRAINAADNGRAEVAEPGNLIFFRPWTAEENEGPPTNDEWQTVLDVVSNILSELSGNEEEAPEMPDA